MEAEREAKEMCEYCRSAPHLPGCPNEPEVDHTRRCVLCGQRFDEEDLTGGVCPGCLDKSFSGPNMMSFVKEEAEQFVEWYFDVQVRHAAYREEVVEALMAVFERHCREDPKMTAEELKDYCSDDTAIWLEFLGVKPDDE